jgi:aryl sulfotransferase
VSIPKFEVWRLFHAEPKEGEDPMQPELPKKLHEYTNHVLLDSTRWDVYKHRPGDIVISTSYKTGTTWMQTIVANLIFQDGVFPAPVSVMSPWLDMALPPLDQVSASLEAQTHRRFIKSHLPLDGLPYFDTARYIMVGRDVRDVFMSMWNHHTGYTDHTKTMFKGRADSLGSEFPLDVEDMHEFWRMWIEKGSFEWESSGYPYWSHLHHAQTWWDFRHVENILLVHFTDLLADPAGQIRRIAKFLDIPVDEQMFPAILERISFSGMKENFKSIMPDAEQLWRGGEATFMNKGTNGWWRGVLTETELDQCRAAVEREMTADCANWLEHGGEHRITAEAVKSGA